MKRSYTDFSRNNKIGLRNFKERKSKQIKIVCTECKKEFPVYPSHLRKRQRCSRECGTKWRKGRTLNTGKTHFKKGVHNNVGENNPMYGKRLELHSGWKGGKIITKEGYIKVKVDTDKKHKYKFEHRIVVEKFIGRKFKKGEIVHHINLNKEDNRIENLMIFPNDREHIKFHTKIRQFGYTNPIKRQINNRWKEFEI